MKSILFSIIVISFLMPGMAAAKLNILTTTTTLKSIVESVGKDRVNVRSITKGPQDPHFVEAKPSYMVMARRADLIIAVGLELEIGWLPNIIRGSRNPKIRRGQAGYLNLGTLIEPIEIISGKVDRSQGDVHALGNPHFTLDPVRVVIAAKGIAKKLSKLDSANKTFYFDNAQKFEKKINQKILDWKKRVLKSGVKKVVTYHRTLNYFLKQFNMELSGSIESKPGIPPTARHIVSLIEKIKKDKVNCLLIESFFETGAANRIKQSVPVRVEVVPTEVGSTSSASNYELLIETIVTSIEKCGTARREL